MIALMVLKGYFFIDLTTVNACRLDGLHGIPPPPSASSDSPSLQEPMGEAFRVLTRHEARTQVEFGKVERWEGFNWGKLLPRTVEVWLPPKPYWDQVSPLPVWYLHDGQNLMDPKIGYGGQSWQLDSLMQVHLADGSMPPCLLVLIDNSSRRFEDYLPPPCLEGLAEPLHRTLQAERQGTALGREYGRWISQELKPWIGLNYPVVADPAAHYLMGASMGGLISSYLLAAYPEHFGGAACLSTHWPLSLKQQDLGLSQPYRSWLAQELDSLVETKKSMAGDGHPGAGRVAVHSLYMDYGDQTLDALYPPHQKAFDQLLQKGKFTRKARYTSRFFPGAAHREADWSKRCMQAMAWVMKGYVPPPDSGEEADPCTLQMYFALTDRFQDGDTALNGVVPGTYSPNKEHYFHGGDFAGIVERIPYLKSMGFNALWITPPVRNQDFNPDSSMTGYHGYWTSDFRNTDPRLGSFKMYRKMAKELKANGIGLFQDVVVNHTGDYFDLDSNGLFRTWSADKPLQRYLQNWPVEPSLESNKSIYHRSGPILRYDDSLQRLQGQMSGLDDLNTGNPKVRRHLKRDYRRWMRKGMLRGMRFDTPLYVEHDFWEDFLHGSQALDPGMVPYARLQKMPFYTFGELWTHSDKWSDSGEKQAASYTHEGRGMDGALNFPLQKTLLEVLGNTRASVHLSYRLHAEALHFPKPQQRLHFLDNHDMPRASASLDSLGMAQGLMLLYTLPGIPVVYYGTELGLRESREPLPARHEETPLIRHLKQLSALRHREASLRQGSTEIWLDSRLGIPVWMAAVERKWVLALNPTMEEVWIPDSLLRRAVPSAMRRGSKPVWRCGSEGSWDTQGLRMGPREAWVWPVYRDASEEVNPTSDGFGKVLLQESGFEAPSSPSSWLKDTVLVAAVVDPEGDDRGSNGLLKYPAAFEGRPGDLVGLKWWQTPQGYLLEISMKEPLSEVWNPPHGMDHVRFKVLLHTTGDGHAPVQTFVLDGWRATGPSPWDWLTDAKEGKVYLLWPRNAGVPALVEVQTWDSDGSGEPRKILEYPGPYDFGGDPLAEPWMDRGMLWLSAFEK